MHNDSDVASDEASVLKLVIYRDINGIGRILIGLVSISRVQTCKNCSQRTRYKVLLVIDS